MSKVLVDESILYGIADAIREKNGTDETYKPSEMADAVKEIKSEGLTFQSVCNGYVLEYLPKSSNVNIMDVSYENFYTTSTICEINTNKEETKDVT